MALLDMWWTNLLFAVFNGILVGFYSWIVYRWYTPRSYAVVIRKDEEKPRIKRINPSKKHFTIKNETYLIHGYPLRYGNHNLYFYDAANSEPLDLLGLGNSIIPAETLHSILENEKLKALARSPSMFTLDNPIVKYGLIAVGAYFALQFFGGG